MVVLKASAQNKESQTDGYAFCHVERKQPLMKQEAEAGGWLKTAVKCDKAVKSRS